MIPSILLYIEDPSEFWDFSIFNRVHNLLKKKNILPGCGYVSNLHREGWFPFSLSETTNIPWSLVVDRLLVLVDEEPPPSSPDKLDPPQHLDPLHLDQEVAVVALIAGERQVGEIGEI